MITGMLVFGLINHYCQFSFISIVNYIQYFLGGFLAIDFYLNNKFRAHYLADILCICLVLLFWCSIVTYGIALPFILAAFIYFSAFAKIWSRVIKLKWLSIIGGMCYSIYMIHHPLMSMVMNRFVGNSIIGNSVFLDFGVKLIIVLTVVLVVSAVFFVLVERPCMQKDWYKKCFGFKQL